MEKTNVRMLVIASVFTAMILLTVMFPFLRILNEYAHIGDGVIYLACVILPAPYAILAASAGAALADIFLGAMLPWAHSRTGISSMIAAMTFSHSSRAYSAALMAVSRSSKVS